MMEKPAISERNQLFFDSPLMAASAGGKNREVYESQDERGKREWDRKKSGNGGMGSKCLEK